MMITDHQKRENGLIIISVYAPIGAYSDEAWTSFFEDYDAALKMCKINNTILAGMDGNSSMGTNDGNVCGPLGIPHINDAGRRMHSFLSIGGLTTATTFFQKKSHRTCIHPRSPPPPRIRPHHHKQGQTLHRPRCRSYREHGRLRPPCDQMQVPYTTKTCKTSTPSSTPQPQPRQTPITRNLNIIL